MPALTPGGLPYPLPTDPTRDGSEDIRKLAVAVDPRMRVAGGLVVGVTGGDGLLYVSNHGLGGQPRKVLVSQLDQGAPQDPFSLVKLRVVNTVGIGFIVYDMRSWTPFGGNQFSFYWWAEL